MAGPICEMWRSCVSRGLREAKAAAAAYSALSMGISHPLVDEFYGGARGKLGLGGALLLSPDRTLSSSPSSCCSPVDSQEGFPDVHAPVYIRPAVLQEEGRMSDAPVSPPGAAAVAVAEEEPGMTAAAADTAAPGSRTGSCPSPTSATS